jgi:hypothetical protein
LPAWTLRTAAGLIALVCWVGLGVRFSVSYDHIGRVVGTLWVLARYFTLIANLLMAVEMTRVALGARISAFTLGGLTIAMILVGVVYALLLANLFHQTGPALFADHVMHRFSPVAMTVFWVVFVPHGRLKWSAPLWWSLLPLTYFVYAIIRGLITHRYAYPFMNVGKIGAGETALNAAAIAAAFILSGYAMVWIDRRLLGRAALLSKAPA